MKFEDVLKYLLEQVPPRDDEEPDEEPQGNLEFPDDDEEEPRTQPNFQVEPPFQTVPPEEPAEPEDNEEPVDQQTSQPTEEDVNIHRETIRRKINAIDRIKEQWQQQAAEAQMNISEADMDDAITFFNSKKNNLRPLSVPPSNRDIPQLYALHQRFPEFPATDIARIRDIQNYTWPQITFFRERYIDIGGQEDTEAPEQDIRLDIEGSNLARFRDYALQQWTQKRKKVYDSNGVMVIRIDSKEKAITYGGLQNTLRDKFGTSNDSNYWCISRTEHTNLYTSYREWRAFYFVFNTNVPANHRYHIFAIGAVKPGHSSGPFTLTSLYNVTNDNAIDNFTKQSFDDVVRETECSQLREIENQIVWFEETKAESQERIYDSFTFDGKRQSDFSFVKPTVQFRFIESGRNIKSGKALRSLGEATITHDGITETVDLQMEYARRTTAMNFQERYVTSDPTEDVFEMISALRPPVKNFLHKVILITQQGLTDGIYSIVAMILKKSLRPSWRDYSRPDIRLFQGKTTTGLFGIYNLETYKWEKPLSYIRQPDRYYLDRESKQSYVFLKYVSANDYFYWVFLKNDYLKRDKSNPNYLRGRFYDGQAGDELMSRFVKL